MVSLRGKPHGIVLALGGGGARGLAHIGVLKVLERKGISVKAIAGTSMGAVIGAMFAHYRNATEIEEIIRKFLSSQFHKKFGRTFFLLSEKPELLRQPEKAIAKLGKSFLYAKAVSARAMFSQNILNEAFRHLLPDLHFSDLAIPFACVTADIRTGKEVVLKEGRLLRAIVASSSIPGFVEPARISSYHLVDGSVTSTVPVAAARALFPGRVVAVDVSMELERNDEFDTAFDIAVRSGDITAGYLTQAQLAEADLIIHPKVGQTTWANFDKLDEMIKAGENAAQKAISSKFSWI